jgi:chemotaxis regulatin CheY-phosphate phosphatase CheZ
MLFLTNNHRIFILKININLTKQKVKMDINALQEKVNELKALFVLGQRVIPFMEDLFVFIGETTPLLEEVNKAIKENLKKMPNATKQLSKVTQATELASTEIMDTVDRVNNELFTIIDELEELKTINEQILINPIQLLETVAEGISTGKDLTPFVTDINLFIDRIKNATKPENVEMVANIIDKVRNISDDANSIINSLQVQDITAQQLAAVNHLLENVQNRLTAIMAHIAFEENSGKTKNNSFDEAIKISKLHRDIAFDPDAVDAITIENRQDDVDALLANPDLLLANSEENEESADDIINNFANSASDNAETVEEYEEFSQDDIDAMFK